MLDTGVGSFFFLQHVQVTTDFFKIALDACLRRSDSRCKCFNLNTLSFTIRHTLIEDGGAILFGGAEKVFDNFLLTLGKHYLSAWFQRVV